MSLRLSRGEAQGEPETRELCRAPNPSTRYSLSNLYHPGMRGFERVATRGNKKCGLCPYLIRTFGPIACIKSDVRWYKCIYSAQIIRVMIQILVIQGMPQQVHNSNVYIKYITITRCQFAHQPCCNVTTIISSEQWTDSENRFRKYCRNVKLTITKRNVLLKVSNHSSMPSFF